MTASASAAAKTPALSLFQRLDERYNCLWLYRSCFELLYDLAFHLLGSSTCGANGARVRHGDVAAFIYELIWQLDEIARADAAFTWDKQSPRRCELELLRRPCRQLQN